MVSYQLLIVARDKIILGSDKDRFQVVLAIPFICIFALLVIVVVVGIRGELNRGQNFRSVAEPLGLEFYGNDQQCLPIEIDDLPLFRQGRARQFSNIICGRSEDVCVAIFEYSFTLGARLHRNKQFYRQSVVSIQSPHLSLPAFELRPGNVLQKVICGFDNIEFDSHRRFSKRFLVRGRDEVSIRAAFTPQVLEFFEQQSGTCVEATGNHFVFYRPRIWLSPNEVRSFMAEGFRVYALFKHQPKPNE